MKRIRITHTVSKEQQAKAVKLARKTNLETGIPTTASDIAHAAFNEGLEAMVRRFSQPIAERKPTT